MVSGSERGGHENGQSLEALDHGHEDRVDDANETEMVRVVPDVFRRVRQSRLACRQAGIWREFVQPYSYEVNAG